MESASPAQRAADLPTVLAALRVRLPDWPSDEPRISALSGGITNLNYRVDAGDRSCVVRLGGNNTHLLGIDRRVEHAATAQAWRLGVGPEVLAFLEHEQCLVTRFVRGTPIPVEAMRAPAGLARVATALRRFHEGPPIPGAFSPFRVVEAYAETAARLGVPAPPAMERCMALARRIGAAVQARGVPCPCHNDLLNANFLEEDGRMVILDWEYAGMGDRAFDLGNFASSHEFDEGHDHALLAAYFGASSAAHFARLRLMRIMSDAREAMWGVVQQGISAIDFDFAAYADRHFTRMLAQTRDPRFDTWLHDAATVS